MLDLLDRPRFSAEAARRIARDIYGLEVDVQQLPSERDQNFLLTRGGEPAWVLKIANKGEKRSVLALQNEALDRISLRDPALAVPRVLPSLDGQKIATAVDHDKTKYMVRLHAYLEGIPLAKQRPHSPELLAAIGRFLGRLDLALEGLEHPAARRPLTWSVLQANEIISQNLVHLTDPDQRSIVETFLATFRDHTLGRLRELRHSIIHNDANDYNVLVHRSFDGAQRVAGLIDFGDIIEAPLVYEAAVAAAYVMQSAGDPLAAAARLVAGYHERLPLQLSELNALYDLITIRLCTTVTMAARNSAREPGQAYLSVSEAGAWRTLELLRSVDRTEAIIRFIEACRIDTAPA